MEKITTEDLHRHLLALGTTFHQLCQKHNIPYFMLGGTMLGAVRHKGFIPWDDDMDFGIPRDHYPRFLQIAQAELKGPLRLLDYHNSEYAVLGFAKLTDTRTLVNEFFRPRCNEQIGVNIDIFPLDYANGRKDFFSFNAHIRRLFKWQKLICFEAKNRPWPKRLLGNVARTLLLVDRRLPSKIQQSIEKSLVTRRADDSRWSMFANYLGGWGLKELVAREVFGTPTLYHFENTQFYGAQHSDAYLKTLYGDYHQLPPVEKRTPHSYEAFRLE